QTLADRIGAAHRVPEVIDVAHANIVNRRHLGPRRVGMSAGDQTTGSPGGPAELDGSGKLSGTRCRLDDPAGQGRLVLSRIGIALEAFRMRTDFFRGEIRPVPVDAGYSGAVLYIPIAADLNDRVKHGSKLCRCAGSRGWEDRRRAVAGVY